MGMYETVVYCDDSQAIRSITEVTTEFVDWLSGSNKDHHDNFKDGTINDDPLEASSLYSTCSSSNHQNDDKDGTATKNMAVTSRKSKSSSSSITLATTVELLSFTQDEVTSIVESPLSFYELQQALRNKGCVTNTCLKENMHHYVYHLKHLQASCNNHRRQRQSQSRSRSRRHQQLQKRCSNNSSAA